MRQIKASEVKPGMEVQFDLSGWVIKGAVGTVSVLPHSVWIYTEKCCAMSLELDSPVTVLSEPQPEEPTWAVAKVVAGACRFVRGSDKSWLRVHPDGAVGSLPFSWSEVCSFGQVTVIPDNGWAVPEDAPVESPVVPERIEEWPEDDTALRPYKWRDTDGDAWCWHWAEDGWGYNHATFPKPFPECFPMTRVTYA